MPHRKASCDDTAFDTENLHFERRLDPKEWIKSDHRSGSSKPCMGLKGPSKEHRVRNQFFSLPGNKGDVVVESFMGDGWMVREARSTEFTTMSWRSKESRAQSTSGR
jgi:hypothetical protein